MQCGAPKGEHFRSFTAEASAASRAGYPTVTDYVWASKTVERQAVPRRFAVGVGRQPHPNVRVLEIGPGTGAFTRSLLQRWSVAEYHLVDADREWLRYCNEMVMRVSPETLVGLHNVSCPSKLVVSAAVFDLAHAHAVFIQLRPAVTAGYIRVLAQALRPGGRLIADFFFTAGLSDLVSIEEGPEWAIYWDFEWMESLANSVGLTVTSTWNEPYGANGMTNYVELRKKSR